MTAFLYKDRDLHFEPLGDRDHPRPTSAQMALWNAIQRLRAGNIQFLLREGVRIFSWPESNGPFKIQWPVFNKNREAFLRTQEVLHAFGLPKLLVIA